MYRVYVIATFIDAGDIYSEEEGAGLTEDDNSKST